ncbi:MAG: DUF421 domain-containing protein [Firmicutes bacterium]|nr:DUF421 domain-containing protein [Bacillota bacterium]
MFTIEVVVRALIVYPWTILLFRLLGKGLTFQQKPYDFMVMMLIGSAAAALIVNRDVPLLNALAALVALAIMHTVISLFSLNNTLKGFIGGKPDLLVRNGRIVKENLIKNQVNLDQLLSGLRNKGYRRIHDVEFAILEANGQLSVIPKSQLRPVNPADLQLKTVYKGIPTPLVIEGKVIPESLRALQRDEAWLTAEIAKRGLQGTEQVLLALLDTDGSLYIAEQPPINPIKAFFVGEGKDHLLGENPDM